MSVSKNEMSMRGKSWNTENEENNDEKGGFITY